MQRVNVDSFHLINGLFVPHLADGNQVLLCAQPGAAEAFLAAPEREVALAGPRGPGKTLTMISDYAQDLNAGWGVALKGLILRRSMTGFDEFRAMCNQYISQIFPGASFNQ